MVTIGDKKKFFTKNEAINTWWHFCSACVWNQQRVITREVSNIVLPLSEPLLLDLSTIGKNKPVSLQDFKCDTAEF